MNIWERQHCNNNRLGILVWMFTDGALCSVVMGTAIWDIWPSGVRFHEAFPLHSKYRFS
jgi:hypothetical protein